MNNGLSNYEEQDQQPNGGAMIRRETFGGSELAVQTETSTTAAAAKQQAMIQARFIMALKRPRIFDDVRIAVLKECDRPGFAEVARYRKPKGKKKNEETGQWEEQYVEGPSIRFVETAVQKMGNIGNEVSVIYDDERKQILSCSVTDYETNATWSQEISFEKTIERRQLKKNQKPIGQRTNSYGDPVYIVSATDDEVREKSGSLVSKTIRTLSLRLIPGDLVEESMDRVVATQNNKFAKDPDAARKDLIEKFSKLGVKAADIVDYFGGKPIDALQPDEVREIRAVGVAIRDEGLVWREVLASSPHRKSVEGDGDKDSETSEKAAAAKANGNAVREKIEQRMKKPKGIAPTAAGDAAPDGAAAPAAPTAPTDAEKAAKIDRGEA